MDDNTRIVLLATIPVVGGVAGGVVQWLIGRRYFRLSRAQADLSREHAELAVQASNYPTRRATEPPAFVTLPPEDIVSEVPTVPDRRPTRR